jgi:hypothetical protein
VRWKASLCGLLGRAEEGREWVRRAQELYPGLTIAKLEHALAMGFAEIWDGLIEPIEIMDVDLAIDWFDGLRGSFTWIAPNDGLFP